MRNLKLVVSYDGTDFHGWQTQPNQRTVQETLETAFHQLTGEKVFANAAGRTDAGVHALGQVVNMRTQTRHPVNVVLRGLNAHLPADVAIRHVEEADPDFDACRHAVRKLYRYVLHDGKVPDLFLRRYCWHIPYGRLDDQAMRQAASVLLGTHDFHSFETEWPNRQSSIRTITRLSVCRLGDLLWIEVEADGFLYNMVRSIVGTLVNIGRGYWPVEKMAEILAAQDRRQAGPTAPPQGLFLVRVEYSQVERPLSAEERSP